MNRSRRLLTALLLGLAGFAFTWFRWQLPLSFNIDLMFASVFVMIAIEGLGAWAGILVGAMTYGVTLATFGHPWFFVLFMGEAVLVSLAARWRRDRLVLFVALYWFFVGAPVIGVAYVGLLHTPPVLALLFASKQLVNGTFNAMAATIVVLAVRFVRQDKAFRPTFGTVVSITVLASVLVPSVVFLVLSLRDKVQDNEAQMVDLATYAGTLSELSIGPRIGTVRPGERLTAGLLGDAQVRAVRDLSIDFTVIDPAGRIAISTHPDEVPGEAFRALDGGDLSDVGRGVMRWLPRSRPGESGMQRWWHSRYVTRVASGPDRRWTIVVELPAQGMLRQVNQATARYATWLALFVFAIVVVSGWLSRRLTGPVVQLQALTRRLQRKLTASAAADTWPTSRIQEVHDLIADVRDFNMTLEHRVIERTRELRVSEARYREVLEGIQLIAVQLDATGAVTFCNDYTVSLLGWTRWELTGRNWFEACLPPDEAAVVAPIFLSAVAANESLPSSYENWIHTRSGERRMVAWNNVTLRGSDGRVSGTTSIGTDVTEMNAAQEALRASEERFSRAFRNAPLLITLSELESGRLIDANDTFLQAIGYARDEVIGRTPMELGMTGSDERHRMVQALTEEGRVSRYERPMRTRDGQFRTVQFWAEVITIGGHATLLSMSEDITDRKASEAERARLEEQLAQATRMEAIGRLAGGVAHDFNNNLTTMMMQLSLLETDPRLTVDTRAALGEVMAAVRRSADLTQQLLMFGRRSFLQVKPLDLREVATNLLAMLRRLLGETIDVTLESPGSLPAVLADRALVEQAVINLAINARDAMPKGGQLRLGLADMTVTPESVPAASGARPGRFVRITVSDTGSGMDQTVRDRLFEPFFTTKGLGEGSGLGLASVHGLVAQHQGWIEVDSAPGIGTTFRLFLPVAPA